MKFAFSLRGMLVAVAYIAIAAAACKQQHKLWDQFLWMLTGGFVLYALLAAALYRGRRQAAAMGYGLFALAFSVVLWQSPETSPANFAGYAMGQELPVTSSLQGNLERRARTLKYELTVAEGARNPEYRKRVGGEYEAVKQQLDQHTQLFALVGALNAIGITLCGVVGALLGLRIAGVVERDRVARLSES